MGRQCRCVPAGHAKIEPMHRPTRAILTGLACAGVSGCGSGGYGPTGLQTAAPPAAAAAARPARVVTMKGLAFRPGTITTTVGRGVEWVNRDDVRHNVTTLDGSTIASPDLPPGGRFAYVPVRAGELRYYCTIHPTTMSGVLIVRA
jgi:plastocyanin